MKLKSLSAASLALALILSCTQEQKITFAGGGGVEKEDIMPEEQAGKTAGFGLVTEENPLRVAIGAKAHVFSEQDEIYLKSAIYHPTKDDSGALTIDVPEATSGTYIMFLFPGGSRFWYADETVAPMKGLVIPYSQFYGETLDLLEQYPMYGTYSGEPGADMQFKEIFGAVSVTVSGNVSLASVHLANNSTEQNISKNIAGIASLNTNGEFVLTEGVNFVNLNCTAGGAGVPVTSSGKTFYLLVAPGNYTDTFTLTLTDMDHKGQTYQVKPFEVKAGQITVLEELEDDADFAYAPDSDLLFFEHFDNFVWGGNVKGNTAVASYAPDASLNPDDNPGGRTGSEQAFVKVGTVTPGSAFIQKEWASVNGWTVGERHSVSDEYITSRNIADMVYMYRCQEYQGCLSVGGGDDIRGGFTPFKPGFVTDYSQYFSVRVSFDVCLRYGSTDSFASRITGCGIVSKVFIDGEEVVPGNEIGGTGCNSTFSHSFENMCAFDRKAIPAPKSVRYEEGWHHVEVVMLQLNELSQVGLWGFDTSAVIEHGAFIDNVEIRRESYPTAAEKPLRVLVWNLQYGMWADQANNFSNFVEFVKRYDPDVCVFCEAKSYWKDNEAKIASKSSYRLFKNEETYYEGSNMLNAEWKKLAARWGHPYHACSNNSMFPQVITSKYEITTIKRYPSGTKFDVPGESSVSLTRGAGHFQISPYGEPVNIVSIHLYPFKYNSGASDREKSTENRDGYGIQRREMKGALTGIIKDAGSKYGDNWLIMGDMNSVSPLDADYLVDVQYSEYLNFGSIWERTHSQVLQSPDRPGEPGADGSLCGELNFGRALFDMVREGEGSLYTGTGRMITSTGGAVRYDMMYGSEQMRRRVDANTTSIRDTFSQIKGTVQYDPEDEEKQAKKPSDHYPVLVEFDMSK